VPQETLKEAREAVADGNASTGWDLSRHLLAFLGGASALPSFTPTELVVRPPKPPPGAAPPQPTRQRKRVVVIGAGLAGLAAAIELAKMDFDVVVVEARGRAGGRVLTADGVDLGAGWVHGIEGNPLSGLCAQAGLSLLNTGESVTMLETNGVLVPRDVDDRMLLEHQQLLQRAKQQGLDAAQQEANAEALLKQQASLVAAGTGSIAPDDLRVVGRCFADGGDVFTVHQVVWSPAHGLKVAWYFDASLETAGEVRAYHYSTLAEVAEWVNAYEVAQSPAHGLSARPSAASPASDGTRGAPLRDEHGASFGLGEALRRLVADRQAAGGAATEAGATEAAEAAGAGRGGGGGGAAAAAAADAAGAAAHSTDAGAEPLSTAAAAGVAEAEAAESLGTCGAGTGWSDLELRLLAWHERNVSLGAGGASLEDLSLRHWDLGAPWAFDGAHCLVKEGYGALVDWLQAQAPPVKLHWPVARVEYGWVAVSAKLTVHPHAGIGLSLEEDPGGSGLVVRSAPPAAPAAPARPSGSRSPRNSASNMVLMAGDVLVAINGTDCSNMTINDAAATVRRVSPGEQITFKALRKPLPGPATSSAHAAAPMPHGGRKCRVVGRGDGACVWADAVLVTLPLGVLKAGHVAFDPPLPAAKQTAIERLGVGQLEKVILRFPVNFWSAKTAGADGNMFFGRVPPTGPPEAAAKRAFFWFLDLSAARGAPCLAAMLPAEVGKQDDEV
jgi:hypothetical protein